MSQDSIEEYCIPQARDQMWILYDRKSPRHLWVRYTIGCKIRLIGIANSQVSTVKAWIKKEDKKDSDKYELAAEPTGYTREEIRKIESKDRLPKNHQFAPQTMRWTLEGRQI